MKRIAISAVTGLAVWFASAVAAEAQQITPTGPLSITSGSTGATYSADIAIPWLQAFAVDVYVYRGNNPNPVSSGTVYVYAPTQLTTQVQFNATWNPGAFSGEKFKFKADLNFNGTLYLATDWIISVVQHTTYVEPSKPTDYALTFIDRDRRLEA